MLKSCLIMTPLENDKRRIAESSINFLSYINSYLEEKIEFAGADEIKDLPYQLIFVGSGGTAREFKKIFEISEGPYILISTPDNNSLAASMEEISYVNDHGRNGEILHGTAEMIANKIKVLDRVFKTIDKLRHTHFGVLGNPNMLINSEYDEDLLLKTTGIRTTLIGMDEVKAEIEKKAYEQNQYTEMLLSSVYDKEEIKKSLYIYGAVKRLIGKYGFDGIALRCFDLLEPYKTSGCLALAILNSEGIPAACEGDTRSLLSMSILYYLTGEPIFMANPSRIDMEKHEMVFAHCTLPITMVSRYSLTTHFESGISVAVKGYFDDGDYTLFKCRENMKDYVVQRAEFIENPNDMALCRSQIKLRVPDCSIYLTNPLSNHQMIAKGDHTEIVNEFFNWIKEINKEIRRK